MNRGKVFEKYGVYPEQMVDYLSLIGDNVDNVPGIGESALKRPLNGFKPTIRLTVS